MASTATVAQNSDAARRDGLRAERYRVQQLLWRHSSVKAIRACGHHAVTPDGVGVMVRTDAGAGAGRVAGFSGLATCGSVWACPVCNSKIAARRAEELAEAVRVWTGTGGRIVMVTLTMRHRRGQKLTELWDALSYAWSKATSGRGWMTDAERYGSLLDGKMRLPWVRAVEATHGDAHGWHLHVHALLFLKGDADADALGCSMFQRWRDALVRKGLQAPLARHGGLDVKEIHDADEAVAGYLAKATYSRETPESAGWELAGGAMKDARRGNRSPFAILRSFVESGDLDDLDLWRDWEQGSRGRRQLTWSVGLREALRLAAEASDEEVASEEPGGELVARIGAGEWADVRHRKADILRAAELLPLETLRVHPVSTWLIALDAFD